MTLKLFSTTFDSILDAIKSLIREPHGCFEQTSATTYPMVMALQLLKEVRGQYESRGDTETAKKVAEMIKDIEAKLKKGYERLISFETSTKGYEWFGKAPGHEALTSYGIKQFIEMQDVIQGVDKDTIKRNADWLVSRRKKDGSGQFDLNKRALDTFGRASQDITDAYIMWVLSSLKEYNKEMLAEEYAHLKSIAKDSKDPYILSLCAGAFINFGDRDLATEVADRLVPFLDKTDGRVTGAKSSITSSNGRNLDIETTSLAALTWMNLAAGRYSAQIELASGFLMKAVEKGGRYGSTQATVLCLQALVKYAKVFGGVKGEGAFVLYVGGNQVSKLAFNEKDASLSSVDLSGPLTEFFKKAEKGKDYEVKVAVEDYKFNDKRQGFKVSYLLEASYFDRSPRSRGATGLKFGYTNSLATSSAVASVGSIQTSKVTLENRSGKAQGMAVAQISVPSCMSVDSN